MHALDREENPYKNEE